MVICRGKSANTTKMADSVVLPGYMRKMSLGNVHCGFVLSILETQMWALYRNTMFPETYVLKQYRTFF